MSTEVVNYTEKRSLVEKSLLLRATKVFHEWAKSPLYEPLDEDLCTSLIVKIRDSFLEVYDHNKKTFNFIKSENDRLNNELKQSALDFAASQAQIAELKAEVEKLENAYCGLELIHNQSKKALESELKEARGVVEHYGDRRKYQWTPHPDGLDGRDLHPAIEDEGGKLARAYLLKYPSEG